MKTKVQGTCSFVGSWSRRTEFPKARFSLRRVGKRISEVGALGAPDIWEQPFHRLDVVYRQGLPHGFSLALKAKNILDLPVRHLQADVRTETYHRGRVFSIAVTKKW